MGAYIAGVAPLEVSLMTRVQRHDENAFHELFVMFKPSILRTAMRILKERASAEDALQETFVNVHRAAGKFRGDSKVGTWINRIAVNACLEIMRKNKKHRQRTEADISSHFRLPDVKMKTPFDRIEQREIEGRVHAALQRLGEKHRQVVQLHDLEGFTIREVAEELQVAEGTIKSRLFYGREKLKSQLLQ